MSESSCIRRRDWSTAIRTHREPSLVRVPTRCGPLPFPLWRALVAPPLPDSASLLHTNVRDGSLTSVGCQSSFGGGAFAPAGRMGGQRSRPETTFPVPITQAKGHQHELANSRMDILRSGWGRNWLDVFG